MNIQNQIDRSITTFDFEQVPDFQIPSTSSDYIQIPSTSNDIQIPSTSKENIERMQPSRKSKDNPYYLEMDFDDEELVEDDRNIIPIDRKRKHSEGSVNLNDSNATIDYDWKEYSKEKNLNIKKLNKDFDQEVRNTNMDFETADSLGKGIKRSRDLENSTAESDLENSIEKTPE